MKKCDENLGVDWDYFDKFENLILQYMPDQGEGETMASQVATAINKLIYKWYNDGDVYDNSHRLEGWCNDLSSYANWLYENINDSRPILDRIEKISNTNQYEEILKDLADRFLEESLLNEYAAKTKVGTIYECSGKFHYIEPDENDDDEEM